MGKFQDLLNLRLKQKDLPKEKMTALAERSSAGNLSSFSGVFHLSKLTEKEKEFIAKILQEYQQEENSNFDQDLNSLISLTSEVKAITNQAILLHGERIKKAQLILKNYKEGAFTAWLISAYGNRQTPYNFLQYFEFYSALPQDLQPKIDEMPRQAIYSLASRTAPFEQKQEIVKNYQGEPKAELLTIIRNVFPLDRDDKRLPDVANQTLSSLKRIKELFGHEFFSPTDRQKEALQGLIKELSLLLEAK